MVTIVEGSEFRKHNGKQDVWWCIAECGCGRRFDARLQDVTRTDGRRIKSCGCAFKVNHITKSNNGKVARVGDVYHKHNGKQNVTCCLVECGYCGKRWEIQATNLPSRKSCGCQNRRSAKHGQTQSRAYAVWSAMKQRCFNPDDAGYAGYGGRGITVCDEWKDDFQAFWAYMGDPPKGMSIDRIDVNGNYEPSNVRWASRKTQQRNRRCNRWLVVDGERMTLAEATERFGLIRESGISKRIKKFGMSETEAVKAPPMRKTHMLTIYGKTLPMKEWCRISGVGYKIAWARLNNGWTHKEAVFGRLKT